VRTVSASTNSRHTTAWEMIASEFYGEPEPSLLSRGSSRVEESPSWLLENSALQFMSPAIGLSDLTQGWIDLSVCRVCLLHGRRVFLIRRDSLRHAHDGTASLLH